MTRWYRAPEILLEDSAYSYQADIWAAGCVLVEILTEGKNLFAGKSDLETLSLICQLYQTQRLGEEEATEIRSMFQKSQYISIVINGGITDGTPKAFYQDGLIEWLKDKSYLSQ